MTPIEKTEAIRDLCSSGLPAKLAAFVPSLADFDEYLNKSPLRADDLELSVYIDFDNNDTVTAVFAVIIQAQIHGKDQVQEYHSVIMPFLEEFLIGSIVGMQQRESIESDLWPMEPEGSTAFAFYNITFTDQLDDCDD